MDKQRSHPYRAYLLRCWQEEEAAPGKAPLWRFSMEEIVPFDPSAALRPFGSAQGKLCSGQRQLGTSHERRRKGFGSLEALVAFLRAELDGSEEALSDEES